MELDFARETLAPKPFVFVLMPFDSKFGDIYKYGIRGAADDVGAYAERVDDQIFNEGILERIFNQISRADVIVADMTGRNPNVFYEVGYAHALGKLVLLLTQKADDIPFDLKHRQHIVYGGKIDLLRRDLAQRLRWAIREAAHEAAGFSRAAMSVRLEENELTRGYEPAAEPVFVTSEQERLSLPVVIRNVSTETLPGFSHVYLFAKPGCRIVPFTLVEETVAAGDKTEVRRIATPIASHLAALEDAPDGLSHQYRLPNRLSPLPSRAAEHDYLRVMVLGGRDITERYRLRFHGEHGAFDFSFVLRVKITRRLGTKERPRSTAG